MAITDLENQELHTQIDNDRATLLENPADADLGSTAVKTYREYAAGKQGCTLNKALASILEGATKNPFADNVLHQIIAEAADRILLLRFDVEDEEVSTFLHEEVYVKNALADVSGAVNYATFRDGNFALMPAWSPFENRIVIHKEDWWDGESGVFVKYDEWQRPEYAVKEWTEIIDKRSVKRRNVYLDAEIRRYKSDGGNNWEPFPLTRFDPNLGVEVTEVWPLPWLKTDGSPLHIPVVHFANGGRGAVTYGTSEIAGGVLGNQDQLNDLRYDMAVCARFTAFQMYWVKGKPETTAKGVRVKPTVGPGVVLQVGEDGAAGVLPAGSISELENTYKMVLRAMCRMTRTPQHVITGDWPSGDALRYADLPAINKARRQLEKLKPSWATLAHKCTEIANAFGGLALNEDAMITPIFDDVEQMGALKESMADREFWTAAKQAVDAGYPLALFLSDKGWTQEQIDALKAENQALEQTAQDAEEATLQRLMSRADQQTMIDQMQGDSAG